MITIDVRDGLKELTKDLNFISQKQVPYATAVAINNSAIVAQRLVQLDLGSHFLLRRKTFIERTVKMLQFAKKADPVAILGIDPKRDLLSKFQTTTTKMPTAGREALAVPIVGGALKTRMSILKPGQRLRDYRLTHTEGGRVQGAYGTFKAGKVILQRVLNGKGWGKAGRRANVRVLFVLERGVPIQKRLNFYEVAVPAIERELPNQFAVAFKLAVGTATLAR